MSMYTEENNDNSSSLNESEALQKIREQAHFIKSITDTIPGIVAINSYPPGEVLFNNHDALEMLGFDADELVAMGYEARLALIFPEDLPALKAYYDRFENLPDNAENRVEYRIKNKYGNLIWLDARGRVFRRDGNGRVIQILQIAQDVTEGKRAAQEIWQLKEEVAQRTNDKYRAIINSIDEGFCLIEVILNEAGKPVDLLYL
ncbi:MAG TPA: PAS domain-containing protein, partial [Niastella sp.]